MSPGWVAGFGLLAFALVTASAADAAAQAPAAAFKSGVEVVRLNAVVRDRKGRFVRDLTARDFEVLDGDRVRPLSAFQHELGGVSIALLFDVSGSMESQLPHAREAATHVLSWLDAGLDEVAVFTFDTRLDEVAPFTAGMRTLPTQLAGLTPFGATSLYDAIAQTADHLASREGRRRAVLVFTDGIDNASRLTPGEVSGIASAIDAPVYLIEVVPEIDNPSADISPGTATQSALFGTLSDLAAWTGGNTFVVSTITQRSAVARQVVEELRQQYLMVFEASGEPGWHPLTVRARKRDYTVRARSGYIAGQSRPGSD